MKNQSVEVVPKFEFNEKRHRYTLDGKPLTGVTTVLGVISKGDALINWAANMAVDYIEEHQAVWGTEDHEAMMKEARKAHVRKKEDAGKKGTSIHSWIEDWITDKTLQVPKDLVAMKQVNEFLAWVKDNDVKFLESEKRMYSEELWLGGTVDAVAEIKGKKYVVDFKTQAKMWDRVPFLQCAAYRMLLESMGEKDIDGSLIVLLPKTGGLETHYSFQYEADKEGFLAALTLYRIINAKN